MRTSRRPIRVAGFTLGLATLAMVASGCSLASPVANSTYAASDGSNAEIGAVKLRNFLVVAAAQGSPGVVSGTITTDSAEPIEVYLTVFGADGKTPVAQGSVTAEPRKVVHVGSAPTESPLQIPATPVQPGTNLTIMAAINSGEKTVATLPILAPTGAYATVTPSVAPAPPPTVTVTVTAAAKPTAAVKTTKPVAQPTAPAAKPTAPAVAPSTPAAS